MTLASCGQPSFLPEDAAQLAAGTPRNLLLLTLDTTRADSLGAYGGEVGVTPALDGLAAAGARFDQAIAPLALTRPSHATMLTGLLPHSHGVWSNGPYRLAEEHRTLAEAFRQAGFATAAVVASFVMSRSFGLAAGFDLYDDATEPDSPHLERNADRVADAALRWLGDRGSTPFLLWLHFYDPHTPYAPPEPHRSEFATRPYLGEVAFMDRAIGRVLSHLEAADLLEGTLIAVVGDHGEALGSHSEDTHGYFVYDDTIRVPLLLKGPGVPAGTVVPEQVTLADLAPTLLDAFGLELPGARYDGRSFWRELQEGRVEERPALIENRAIQHQYGWAPLRGIRVDGWKWIRAPISELYHLVEDPGESRNLASSHAAMASKLERLRRELLPEEPAPVAGTGLSPEEEEKLRALGYLAAIAPAGSGPPTGPDPKQVAAAIAPIEALTEMRQVGGDKREAELVEAILELDPTNLFALRLKGEQLVESGRFPEAIVTLEPIVEGHETHPEAVAYLARAYQGAGRIREAVDAFSRATQPPWIYWPATESLAKLARIHPEAADPGWLVARLDQLRPVSARERLSVARSYALLSEFRRAEDRFEDVLEADPSLAQARVGLGQMQAAQGRGEEALATLAGVRPPTVESVFVTGSILWRQGSRDEACDQFRRAPALGPRNVNLLFGLGRHLEGCGEAELARTVFELLLSRQPDHPGGLEAARRLDAERRRDGTG